MPFLDDFDDDELTDKSIEDIKLMCILGTLFKPSEEYKQHKEKYIMILIRDPNIILKN